MSMIRSDGRNNDRTSRSISDWCRCAIELQVEIQLAVCQWRMDDGWVAHLCRFQNGKKSDSACCQNASI
jgi:hypothetical protein